MLPSKWDIRVDGDTILCRAGFSADSNSDEMSHSLYNVKMIINSIRSKFPGTCKVFLSGKKENNFRYNLTDTYKSNRILKCKNNCDVELEPCATIQYSGTRYFRGFECPSCGYIKPDTKPVYYQEIRNYLLAKFNAEVVTWGEADDWLGVDVNENTVIVSNDKDLLMIPCYHYRLISDKLLETSDPGQLWLSEDRKKLLGGGFKWFCCQMILGDAVDGIIKPKADHITKTGKNAGRAYQQGLGPVKVFNRIIGLNTAKTLWNSVDEYYKENGYTDEDILLAAQLLWISRKAKQMFTFELLEQLIEEIDNGNES